LAGYIGRRIAWAILTLFVITGVTFVVFYVLPTADPAVQRAGRSPSPELVASIRHQLGLDRSLPHQYLHYCDRLFLHFDFGNSFINNTSVKSLVFSRLPNTIFLVVGAGLIWFVSGVTIGTISAVRTGSFSDRALMGSALMLISAPVYWLGLVCLFLFSDDIGKFKLFPGAGAYQDAHGFFGKCWTLVMPWCVLAAAFAAVYARVTRSNVIEAMGQDYIRTARAKGLTERRIVVRHGVRAAITPVVTMFGMDLGLLMGGAILTEGVFNIDGIGRLSYDAIQRGDLATIQGTTLILAFAIALSNLVVDIVYAFLDPRVRYT
jgi:peptide/nickel transport system permease protein